METDPSIVSAATRVPNKIPRKVPPSGKTPSPASPSDQRPVIAPLRREFRCEKTAVRLPVATAIDQTPTELHPGERLASATWWKCRQPTRRLNVTRAFKHGDAKSSKNAVNRAFASGWRSARVHQPADAGRSPVDSCAFPKPASSRIRTTRPRRLTERPTVAATSSHRGAIQDSVACSGLGPSEAGP